MKQFEIWWANLPKPAGRRPVLLISRNGAYEYLNKFIVAEITTTVRSIPVEVRRSGTRDCAPPVSPTSIISEPSRESGWIPVPARWLHPAIRR